MPWQIDRLDLSFLSRGIYHDKYTYMYIYIYMAASKIDRLGLLLRNLVHVTRMGIYGRFYKLRLLLRALGLIQGRFRVNPSRLLLSNVPVEPGEGEPTQPKKAC